MANESRQIYFFQFQRSLSRRKKCKLTYLFLGETSVFRNPVCVFLHPTSSPPPPTCCCSPSASPPCVCSQSILSFCGSFSHPPSLASCAARGLSDQSSRTPDRKERKANSAGKKRRRSPSPPSTPAESRKKGGRKG